MTDISGLGLLDYDYITLRVIAGGEVEGYLKQNKVPTYQTYLKGMQDIYDGTVSITNNYVTNNETNIDNSTTTNVDNSVTNIDNSTTNIDNSTTINNTVTNTTDNSVTTNNIKDSNIGNITGDDNNGSVNVTVEQKTEENGNGIAGALFTLKGLKYRVNDDEKTASLVCAVNDKKKSITIPSMVTYKKKKLKVTDIEKGAFRNMKKFKTLTIGSNVENIGERAFYNCPYLKNVTFGRKVCSIGKMCFYGDRRLKNITFKNLKNLKTVDKAAFYLKTKKTDAGLKKKQTSKKSFFRYLRNSGVNVKG
jgi:hypothetical protein